MKLNVGDKVRVVLNGNHFFPVGNIVDIVHEYPNGTYEAFGYGDEKKKIYQTVEEQDIELVKDDTQVKHHAPIVYEVYEALKKNVGEENAISASDLCYCLQISSHRELREIMREIRRSGELEKIPCSCNKGYYMASTKEEAMKSINRILNAAKNEFKTGYIMLKKLGLDKQMKIPLGEYFKDTYHSLMGEEDETNTETD